MKRGRGGDEERDDDRKKDREREKVFFADTVFCIKKSCDDFSRKNYLRNGF